MPSDKLSSLSIFFPAFNEEANIETTILDALKIAPQVSSKFEVICVDDGSTDRTAEVVKSLQQKHKELKVVSHPHNLGYGAAIKTGLANCQYDWVFYTDSDGQFKFTELPKFVTARDKADLILGYRKHRQDPWIRIFIAKVLLKTWNFLLYGLLVKDADCSYKLFPRKLLKEVKLITSSAITETELLVKLINQGYTYHELPVTHYSRYKGNPTGANPSVIIKALKESLILWHALRFQ